MRKRKCNPNTGSCDAAANGEYVDGWAYINSYQPHPLPGGADVLYPKTENIGESGYAEDYNNWFNLTVAPLIPGQLIGIPVYTGGENMAIGNEVAAATGGYCKVAASGNGLLVRSGGMQTTVLEASGAKVASVRICHQYRRLGSELTW